MFTPVNEIDLHAEYQLQFDHQCELIMRHANPRRINLHPLHRKEDVPSFIKKFVEERRLRKIAFSDSVTLHQCDVYKNAYADFASDDYEIINPFERTADGKYKVFEDQPLGERLDLPRDEYYRRIGG